MSRKDLRAYRAWMRMKSRCDNPAYNRSHRYLGRGITYEPRWKDFLAFYEDMGDCPDGFQLDRIDNDGNYSRANCHWVHPRDNVRNRSVSRLTYRKVRLIKGLLRSRRPGCSLLKMANIIGPLFNVKSDTIRKVAYGRLWAEVP